MFYRILASIAVLMTPSLLPAQAFIDHLSPPAIERGKTTRVKLVGHHLDAASALWTSLPIHSLKSKVVESSAAYAILEIEVAADAPVGLFGVRLATRDGLSNAHLFLIDDLPVRARTAEEPMKCTLPIAVCGTFREAEIDRYRIEVKAGQLVSFEIVGSRFGKDADPLLTIRDSQGKWIAERDNDQGLYYDCRFEHRFAEAGTFTVEVRDARFRGSVDHPYVLRMGRFPAGRVAVPSAVKAGRNEIFMPELSGSPIPFECPSDLLPGPFFAMLRRADDEGSTWLPLTTTTDAVIVSRGFDEPRAKAHALSISPATTLAYALSPLRANLYRSIDALIPTGRAQATAAKVPGVLCGVLRKPGERQTFSFEMVKGQSIHVRGEAQALNSPADLELVLVNHLGREQKRGTENRGEVVLDFTANAPGTFGLTVRDQLHDGGAAFAYRLTASDKPFPPLLTAEVEGVTVPRGSYQPIPIAILRNGTTGPIKLKLIGAPPGLKIVPDEIGEKEIAIVCKLEADAQAPLGILTLQIVAESSSGPTLVKTLPMIDKQLINVDLILHSLREDQRRLPPSVADRLAVQVTAASPFEMVLREPAISLARYQQAEIPIATTRQPGFDGPILFTAKGGQLADKKEGRTRVYVEFPEATAKASNVVGSIHSKILSNLGKSRIEVTGTAILEGRRISLTRTFELNLTTAFAPTVEPAKVSLLPGESTKIRLLANRLKTFDGEVKLRLTPIPGLNFPEWVAIPKGASGIDINISAPADAMPRKQNVAIQATAAVDGFEEERRDIPFEVEIRKK